MRRHSDMSIYERVGRIVLLPFKAVIVLVLLIVGLPLLIICYPFVSTYVFFKAEGSLKERAQMAAFWPLSILAMNDFLSLGGMNNPTLSRLTSWLERIFEKK